MNIQILAFGIAKDIVGGPQLNLALEPGATVAHLKSSLIKAFPKFTDLTSIAIAVNSEYAEDDQILESSDEIVIIPPVSGG